MDELLESKDDLLRFLDYGVEILDSYDRDTTPPDYHFEIFVTATNLRHEPQQFRDLVAAVFDGCVKYDAALTLVISEFYKQEHNLAFHAESNYFLLLLYLSVFKLNEMSIKTYERILKARNVIKASFFVRFLFDEKRIKQWLRERWCNMYDPPYVDSVMLVNIRGRFEEVKRLLDKLQGELTQGAEYQKKEADFSGCTKPVPFQLTAPRPRAIPVPEMLPTVETPHGVPDSTYQQPVDFEELAAQKQRNRLNAERLLDDVKRRNSGHDGIHAVNKRHLEKCGVVKSPSALSVTRVVKPTALPDYLKAERDNIPVRVNAAQLLREERLYKQRERKLVAALESLEAGAFDSSGFEKWQSKMKTMDREQEELEAEKRRLENKLTQQAAILNREEVRKEKHMNVLSIKELEEHIRDEVQSLKEEEEREKREQVVLINGMHESMLKAKQRVAVEKKSAAREIAEENQRLRKEALQAAEEELRKRLQIIADIRALEASLVNVRRDRPVDFTETPGFGFLNEMSIAELKERLALVREEKRKEEEQKRDEILMLKQRKQEQLIDAMETISRHREQMTRAAAIKQETRKKEHEVAKADGFASNPERRSVVNRVFKNPEMKQLSDKLQRMRGEAQSVKAAVKERAAPSKTFNTRAKELAREKGLREVNRWTDMEETQQRIARLSAAGLLVD